MITKQDIYEAIAECQGTRNPNANTAIKLAAFYTILDHLDDSSSQAVKNEIPQSVGYSLAAASGIETINYDGASEFAKAINGKQQSDVLPVLDELMSTVKLLNSRLYDNVMRNLHG